MRSKACTLGGTQQEATDDTIARPSGGDGLRQFENQHMLSSFCFFISFLSETFFPTSKLSYQPTLSKLSYVITESYAD